MVVLNTDLIYSALFSEPHLIVIMQNGIKQVHSNGSKELYESFINSENHDNFYRKHIAKLEYEIEELMINDEYYEEKIPNNYDD